MSIIPHISLAKSNHMVKLNVNVMRKYALAVGRDYKSHGNVYNA